MSLLDTIIANTTNGYTVLSENHNVADIYVDPSAVTAAVTRAAGAANGVWDAAEYGISREAAQAALEAADTPEAREAVMRDLKARAVARAGLDTSNGKVALFVAGRAPWHRLGVNVAGAVDAATAIRIASMEWEVLKQELFYTDATGTSRKAPGVFGLVRQDTGEMLGSVGSGTKVIQNLDGFKFLDKSIGQFGARFISAGSIHGGKKVFMQVELPGQSFTVNGTDRTNAYAIFTNCHDGSGSARCFPTSERVECANTFRIAVNANGRDGISIPHVGNIETKIEAAQAALGIAVKGFADYAEKAAVLAATPANVTHYANDVLDAVLDMTQADMVKGVNLWEAVMKATTADVDLAKKSFEQKAKARRTILDDILERYESETNGKAGMRGTAWAAFNAITESADHGKLGVRHGGSEESRQSSRFESVLNGRADAVKQVAYAKAVALAR